MERKSIQLVIIALALLLALSAAWFLFKQSTEYPASRQEMQEKKQASSPSASEKGEDSRSSAGENATNGSLEAQGSRTDSTDLGEADSRKVVTSAFVMDLAEFVVSRYHPEWDLDNPREKGILRLSFRALNVRYGTDLTGLSHSSSSLKAARREILGRLLNSDILKHAYIRFADGFVQAMVRLGENSTRRVKAPDGTVRERALTEYEIAEMLHLGSSYLRDVSAVLLVLVEEPGLDLLIGDYLEAKDQAVHDNYRLNQVEEELKDQRRGADGSNLEELRDKRREIVEDYSRAIAKREHARQDLVDKVMKGAEESIELGAAEILYIAEWVHRRLPGEENRSAIVTGGRLLRDLADRLKDRARDLEAG